MNKTSKIATGDALGGGGENVNIREVVPEDAPALDELLATTAAEDVRSRFLVPRAALDEDLAEQLATVDGTREVAFVALPAEDGSRAPILGGVRLIADRSGTIGEYAILVHSDAQGRGLGRMLMERIIAEARARGVHEVVGLVLRTNAPMLRLCETLGFTRTPSPDDSSAYEVRRKLCRRAANG